jgi:hypothetical protein
MHLGLEMSMEVIKSTIENLGKLWGQLEVLKDVWVDSFDFSAECLRGLFSLRSLDITVRGGNQLPQHLLRMRTISAYSPTPFCGLLELSISFWPDRHYLIELLGANPNLAK